MAIVNGQAEFICAICCDEYKDPVIIQCHHSFCRKCITVWINHNKSFTDTYTCPTCKAVNESSVPLKTSFYVEQMRDLVEKTKTVPYSYPSCDKHPDEDLRFYCKNCQKTVCRDCKIVQQHQGHNFETVETVASEMKAAIKESIDDANKDKFLLKARATEVEDLMVGAQQEEQLAITNCRKRSDELKAYIDSLTATFIYKIKENVHADTANYIQTKAALKADIDKIDVFIEKLTRLCDTDNDHDVVSNYHTIVLNRKPGFDEATVAHQLSVVHHKRLFEISETKLTDLQDMLGNVPKKDILSHPTQKHCFLKDQLQTLVQI